MKITAITAQKRRGDRYSVYVDGVYVVSLGETELLESRLRIGDEVTEEQLQGLEKRSLHGKALDRAYNYLSYRPRSVYEVTTYLRRKQYDDPVITQVLSRLSAHDLLDDAKFAADWIESRQLLGPRSRQKLRVELRQKGIAADIIEAALVATDSESEVENAIRLVNEKRLLQRYDDERKLLQYLVRQGFSYDAAKTALLRILEED